jgi:hypothetical protein
MFLRDLQTKCITLTRNTEVVSVHLSAYFISDIRPTRQVSIYLVLGSRPGITNLLWAKAIRAGLANLFESPFPNCR